MFICLNFVLSSFRSKIKCTERKNDELIEISGILCECICISALAFVFQRLYINTLHGSELGITKWYCLQMCIRFYAFNFEINKCSKSRFSDRINEIASLSLSLRIYCIVRVCVYACMESIRIYGLHENGSVARKRGTWTTLSSPKIENIGFYYSISIVWFVIDVALSS